MLPELFQDVYNIFKKNFYKSMCENSKELTMSEAFCLDVIYMLEHPTILEFANYMKISQPNATYKINQMVNKGYLTKQVCQNDKRAYRLYVTDKFLELYRDNDRFISKALAEIEEQFDHKDIEAIKKMLEYMKTQLSD